MLRSTKLLLENGTATVGSGSEPQQIYKVIGRDTKDSFKNKTITDPSNTVAASQLTTPSGSVAIENDGVVGDVLTRTMTGASFLPPTALSNSPYDIVIIPFFGPTATVGSLNYFDFAAPIDVVGTSASSVTVQAAANGQEFVCTKQIDILDAQIGLQYITQAGARRTFLNVSVNGIVQPSPGAQTVVAGINNFRQSFTYLVFGLGANNPVQVVVDTNATAPITVNSGRCYLMIPK